MEKSFKCADCGFKKPTKILSKNTVSKQKVEKKTFCLIKQRVVSAHGPCEVYGK